MLNLEICYADKYPSTCVQPILDTGEEACARSMNPCPTYVFGSVGERYARSLNIFEHASREHLTGCSEAMDSMNASLHSDLRVTNCHAKHGPTNRSDIRCQDYDIIHYEHPRRPVPYRSQLTHERGKEERVVRIRMNVVTREPMVLLQAL